MQSLIALSWDQCLPFHYYSVDSSRCY